jgi:hypothetical protein
MPKPWRKSGEVMFNNSAPYRLQRIITARRDEDGAGCPVPHNVAQNSALPLSADAVEKVRW